MARESHPGVLSNRRPQNRQAEREREGGGAQRRNEHAAGE